MAHEPNDRDRRTHTESGTAHERRPERKSNTTNIAAVIGGLVIAVLAIWWLVGGFDNGGEQIADAEPGVEATEQVGAGVEGEAGTLEGEEMPVLEEENAGQTEITE